MSLLRHTAKKKRRRGCKANSTFPDSDQFPSILPRELLVLDPVRDRGIRSEAALLVLLVIGEVALEPFHVAVAFEGENMRGDAVEEPAIVRDDDGAARVILERLFERAQGIHVEIVGR